MAAQADAARLQQVLFNLLSNATKFTPDGGIIRVELARQASSSFAVIKVADSGPGIAPQHRAPWSPDWSPAHTPPE